MKDRELPPDLLVHSRPTLPTSSHTKFIEQSLTAVDTTLVSYADAILKLTPPKLRAAAGVLWPGLMVQLGETGTALEQWNTADNAELMGQCRLCIGQVAAFTTELDIAVRGAHIEDPYARPRRMSGILAGPRLFGSVLALVRIFEKPQVLSIASSMVQVASSSADVRRTISELRKALDAAALSPLELHQAKAGARDSSASLVQLCLDALEMGEQQGA